VGRDRSTSQRIAAAGCPRSHKKAAARAIPRVGLIIGDRLRLASAGGAACASAGGKTASYPTTRADLPRIDSISDAGTADV
jgi:hypothetical protein